MGDVRHVEMIVGEREGKRDMGKTEEMMGVDDDKTGDAFHPSVLDTNQERQDRERSPGIMM